MANRDDCRLCGIQLSKENISHRKATGHKYLCQPCSDAHYKFSMRNVTPAYRRAYHKSYYRQAKLEVFAAYGNKCACCGEDQFEFLTIDHINGGGSIHKRSIIGGRGRLYYWLRQNNYPDEFQLLCFNCNCAKGVYGTCPHTWDDGELHEPLSYNPQSLLHGGYNAR